MKKKWVVGLLIGTMMTGMLAGCGQDKEASETGKAESEQGTEEKKEEAEGETEDTADGEKITLTVWDTFTEDAMHNSSEQINEMFMEKYPNVTIDRVSKDYASINEALKTAFMSGDAPDVMYNEMGIGEQGSFLRAGYLMNLQEAYSEYGWDDTVMAVSKEVPAIGDYVYGVGNEIETMSFYYNKKIFDEVGLDAPGTIEELTETMGKLKEAGYVPLANTLDSDWSNNMNFIGTIMYAYMSQEEIDACMNEDASWDMESVKKAAATIQEWLDKGYFPDHPEVDGEQRDFFLQGEGACWVTGNWSIAYVEENADDTMDLEIIPFPGSESCSDGGSQVNFTGSGYLVNANTPNKKAALDYLDFCVNNAETAKIWSEVGVIIPPFTGEYDAEISPELTKVKGYLSDENISNVAGINMWLGTNGFDFFSDAGQRMAIGDLTAENFTAEADAARQKDMDDKNTKATFELE